MTNSEFLLSYQENVSALLTLGLTQRNLNNFEVTFDDTRLSSSYTQGKIVLMGRKQLETE